MASAASISAGAKAVNAAWSCSSARMMPLRRGSSVIVSSLFFVMPGLVSGIQPTADVGIGVELDPGNRCRDDMVLAFLARLRCFLLLLQLRLEPAEHTPSVALEDARLVLRADGERIDVALGVV